MSTMQPILNELTESARRVVQILENQRLMELRAPDEVQVLTEIRHELEQWLGYLSQANTARSKMLGAVQHLGRILEARGRDFAGDASRVEGEIGAAIRKVEEGLAIASGGRGGRSSF